MDTADGSNGAITLDVDDATNGDITDADVAKDISNNINNFKSQVSSVSNSIMSEAGIISGDVQKNISGALGPISGAVKDLSSSLSSASHLLSLGRQGWSSTTTTGNVSSLSLYAVTQNRKHRVVSALDGPCPYCQKEMNSFMFPFERPYYEDCQPMAEWQTTFYPSCNKIHEFDLIESKVVLLSVQGSWRSVWKTSTAAVTEVAARNATFPQSQANPQVTENAVLKLLNFETREFDHESFHYHRVDAMAMERLTSSPYIVNIYGHCGQTVLTEFADGSARTLVKNANFSSYERLRMGRDLARAFAAIHSIDTNSSTNPTLAHNDINMANVVQVNGQLKLNDFNLAVLMKWNATGNKPCGAPIRFEAILWKSPEEVANISYIDPAQADVYGLGSLLFQVMTKHQPWTHLEPDGPLDKKVVLQKKLQGALPFVPEKHAQSKKTSIQALYYATLSCFRPNPQDRLTSHQLARLLDLIYQGVMRKREISRDKIQMLFDKSTLPHWL